MKRKCLTLLILAMSCSLLFGQAGPVPDFLDFMSLDVTKRKGTPHEWSLQRKTISLNIDPDTAGMGAPPLEEEIEVGEEPDPEPKNISAIAEKRVEQEINVRKVQEALRYNTSRDPFKAAGIQLGGGDWEKIPLWMLNEPDYFPRPDLGMRLNVASHYLRVSMYPEKYSIPETINHLIDIGQAGLFAAQELEKAGDDLGRVAQAVLECVGEPAPALDAPDEGSTPEETFMFRLIQEELGTAYLYQPQPGFAKHLADMGEAAIPWILDAALYHKSVLVRRNAVGLLGDLGDTEVIRASLRYIVKEQEDQVCTVRALFILARLKDEEIVPWLLDRLRMGNHKNPAMQHLAAFCLSEIGARDAVEPLLRWAEGTKKYRKRDYEAKREIMWTAVQALLRLRVDSARALKVYKRAQKEFKGNDAVRQFGFIGGMLCKDKKSETEVLNMLSYKENPLAKVEPAACGLMVAILKEKQKELERDYLAEIVKLKNEDLYIQIVAMAARDFQAEDIHILEGLIESGETNFSVRTIALMRMWDIDKEKCRLLARAILNRYLKKIAKRDMSQVIGSGFEALTAMRILGPSQMLTIDEVVTIIDQSRALVKKYNVHNKKTAANENVNPTYPAPIYEHALIDLGKFRSEKGLKFLMQTLQDSNMMGREEAVKGLYFIGNDVAIKQLVLALDDPDDGWVRHYAAYCLSQISGETFECNWAYGLKEDLHAGRIFWRAWHKRYLKEQKDNPKEDPEDE